MSSSAAGHEERDLALFAAIREGDSSAFGELLQKYWVPIVRYANRFLNHPDAAEDVAQEAFVRFWSERARWDPTAHPRAILYHVARNLMLNEERSARVRAKWAATTTDPACHPLPTPAQAFDERELEAVLVRAINLLPERRREVFRLVRHGGLTYRQVAEVMGITVQTVANQMTAALNDLRRAVDPLVEDWSSWQAKQRPSGR